MSSQILLRLLVISLLLQTTLGIVCYLCETKTLVDHKVDEKEVVVAAPPPPPDTGSKDGRRGRNLDGHTTEKDPETTKKAKHETLELKDPECLEGSNDSQELWAEQECGTQYRACFVLKGKIAERGEGQDGLYTITRRGCFHPSEGGVISLGNKTFVADQRITVDVPTTAGDFKATAKLTVCDDLNGGQMLCNGGTMREPLNIFMVSVTIVFFNVGYARLV